MILHGNNIIIKADGTAIAAAKSCTIEVTAKTTEVAGTSNGDWEYYRAGRKSWNVTTNHLVTSVADSTDMVGSEVSIEIGSVQRGPSSQALPFAGLVNNVTALQQSTIEEGDIMYDIANKYFVMRIQTLSGDKYYRSWSDIDTRYFSPSAGDMFYNTASDLLYRFTGTALTTLNLSGDAIVKTWRGTFTRGNLAQGSFTFLGSGPLE